MFNFKKLLLALLLTLNIYANDFRAIDTTQYVEGNARIKIYEYGWYYNKDEEHRKNAVQEYEEKYYDFYLLDRNNTVIGSIIGADKIEIVKLKGVKLLVLSVVFNNALITPHKYYVYKITSGKVELLEGFLSPTSKNIYKKGDEYFMDVYSSEGMPTAKCNSCQTYKIITYKFKEESFELQK